MTIRDVVIINLEQALYIVTECQRDPKPGHPTAGAVRWQQGVLPGIHVITPTRLTRPLARKVELRLKQPADDLGRSIAFAGPALSEPSGLRRRDSDSHFDATNTRRQACPSHSRVHSDFLASESQTAAQPRGRVEYAEISCNFRTTRRTRRGSLHALSCNFGISDVWGVLLRTPQRNEDPARLTQRQT
ncbi:hypothetical protein CIHG_06630 [Coccidioides immitis H538.4]|uniref:Uncharacterized protein n=3 Tax=Coccidioides immitis TaxID=5501 RepID=A0A0J8TFG3_COCIT|nr:hypothetical protein CIRG_08045 [Coccidioides immitis RMSCC 2394]KMU72377.1 hypothetical protein CISG_03025 [Coccidioides immitis RMSCC 3703]KMU88689.1 hypothetical protein CIHG_06630 [Coccidioides immitis H538.4]